MALPFGRRPHRSDATASMSRIGRRHRDSPPGLAAAVVKRHLGNDLSKIQVRQAGALFLLAKHGARVIADGPDGSTVIVGGLLVGRMLFQELIDHRLLAVDYLLPCEAVAFDLGNCHSAKLAVFRCGQVAALLRNHVAHGSHRRIVLLFGILREYWC